MAANGWIRQMSDVSGRSIHTIRAYKSDLADFFSFLSDVFRARGEWYSGNGGGDLLVTDLAAVGAAQLREWLAIRSQRGVSSRSNARAMSVLRSFFAYIATHFGVINHHVEHLKVKKVQRRLPRVLEQKQAMAAIDVNSNDMTTFREEETWIQRRNRAIILLLYGCGLRISEALSLTVASFHLGDGGGGGDESGEYRTAAVGESGTMQRNVEHLAGCCFITVRGKGSKQRMVPVLPEVMAAVQDYLVICPYECGWSRPIFVGQRGGPLSPDVFRAYVRQLRSVVGVSQMSPHTFRHSFASHMLANGADLRVIQDLLGHSRLTSTQVYTAVEGGQLRRAHQQFHPRARLVDGGDDGGGS